MASRGEEQLRQAVKRLQHMSFGQLGRMLRNRRNRQVLDLLDRLGPSGKLIKDVARLAVQRGGDATSLKALHGAIKHSGAAILPPLDKRGRLPAGYTQRQADEIAAQAAAWLEARGYRVQKPEEKLVEARDAARRRTEQSQRRGVVTLPLPDGNVPHEYSVHHPMVTREMVPVGSSSNVHSYGYDWRKRRLYVRFLATGADGSRGGKGPLYGYEGVPPRLFLDLLDASSKGVWVWDNLRIRGTYSGHQFDYALRGLGPSLYVPRKATLTAEGEAFIPREFLSYRDNRVHRSELGEQLVRPLRPGFPDRPDRGGFRRES